MTPTTLTPAEIAELERLDEAATPGPWFLDTSNVCCGVSQGASYKDRGVFITDETTMADGALIVAVRNALPRLLSELEQAKKTIDGFVKRHDTPLGYALIRTEEWQRLNRIQSHRNELSDTLSRIYCVCQSQPKSFAKILPEAVLEVVKGVVKQRDAAIQEARRIYERLARQIEAQWPMLTEIEHDDYVRLGAALASPEPKDKESGR